MARSNNVLGIIFANAFDDCISQLTSHRTMASVPFGGKYRLVDFPLSNMTNAGINNVGLITACNYLSLMDHVGSGSAWDLSKRRSGLSILPPYAGKSFDYEIDTISYLHGYFEGSDEEYVLLCYSNSVANIDYQKMYYDMLEKKADISFLYIKRNSAPNNTSPIVADVDNGRINKLYLNPNIEGECNYICNSMIIRKKLLLDVVRECVSVNNVDTHRVMLNIDFEKYKVVGFEHKGFYESIYSIQDYYDVSMMMMDDKVRKDLFYSQKPIYTKIRDDEPSRYGFSSRVKGSLVSQGCSINGSVDNSILSKGVVIGRNAVLKNCIVMQDTVIGDDANLCNVIIDKDCVISENTQMVGAVNYPVFIAKGMEL